ncbi:MAG: bifunctional aspartate kinase/homoserine dehydrogenase I [Buchnera aphidicola (Periphyllus lyropictus)]|uniref:bifunctional aspartate kinase/homoserine dehydrogenase I n=1 Tax=Buchnera aphidicola TaxID=9 RepID=UPI001EBE9647|nr:bifunctional aspartate kinase/homoserine dehydrogenase I [Buchnera aphidicola]NIH16658.1 bifunctional aspartate kinase/homoserine dehydrogenase I [Buchnera aphidicola (Periphyllus lyropictus)]USS94567.1 bifunctional aspartate kinase/homoserine dehydrogenase I [Buchnera aphidicola (Periphyllus lyropictus)]
MINVLKFGGTSLKNSKTIFSVSKIIQEKCKKNKIAVVLSAPAKITNYLEKLIKIAINKKRYEKKILYIKKKFYKIIKKIYKKNKKFNFFKTKKKIDKEINFIQKNLKSIYILNQCPDNTFAKIISRGEILSTYIMKNILISKKYNVDIINPVKNIITFGKILDSYVNIPLSNKNLKKIKIKKNSIILMPGFIAGDKKKKTVLLGRNGSDYSAAILSACFKAKVCEIWTDVDGILTCDPKIVSNPKIIKKISYQNITELSNLGAKVLHHKTIKPLQKFNIPCHIKNTFNKNKKGTEILDLNKKSKKKYHASVTYIKNICMFLIKIKKKENIKKIQKILIKSIKFQNIFIFSLIHFINQNSIKFYCKKKYKKIIKKIIQKKIFKSKNEFKKYIIIKKKLSIISVIKYKITKQKKLINKIKKSLYNSNIKTFLFNNNISKNSISIILKSKHIKIGIKLIHKIIINKKKIIEIFLLGIGGIGKTLLNQISLEKSNLKKLNITINICLISNSNKILFNENKISIKNWKKDFQKIKKKYEEKDLIKTINKITEKNYYINPVIIDCTSSKKISHQYYNYIKNGFHIVTPNKKFNTRNTNHYKKIRKIAKNKEKNFFYETNVGGGLPIIQTIKNLKNTGDKLISFKGILSGSLSYIFGKLEQGISFSEAIKKAKNKGLTEPDPRDDLSGLDVARKLLIIAREFGYQLELKNIIIKNILPEPINKKISIKKFLKKIEDYNKYFYKKVSSAKINNKKIKFIGKINKNGICSIKISKIHKNDPLYGIKNGENALSFYSKYYHPMPLVIRGYGAGKEVTASGVFSDLLKIVL